jgi:hypothetical protein
MKQAYWRTNKNPFRLHPRLSQPHAEGVALHGGEAFNKYGKHIEISKGDIKIGRYKLVIKGFL